MQIYITVVRKKYLVIEQMLASSIVFKILCIVAEHVECVFKRYKRILLVPIA